MEREFKEIVGVLKEAKRRKYIQDFALTGALALSALTQPRATRDIDFILSLENDKNPFSWNGSNPPRNTNSLNITLDAGRTG